jgi:hypothetical protein
MPSKCAIIVVFFSLAVSDTASMAVATPLAQDISAQTAVARQLGTIKAISGNAITLAADTGSEVAVTVAPNAKIARVAPGGKELTLIQLSDLQVGDRVRVRGYASTDAKSMNCLEVIVITSSAVDSIRDQIRQDWQKRGVGGIVDSVDPSAGTVTVSIPGLAGKKTIVVHTSASTIIHRYAPDSPKPEDAKSITLQSIQIGDQLRARGNRNADGSEITAEEIYTGVFPKFVGTIKSIDASAGTLSVQDLITKKIVQVKVTSDSQLHKIPAEMAQRFAARLKGAAGGAPTAGAPSGNGAPPATAGTSAGGPGGGMGGTRGGAPDFQQIVNRLPASTLADLNLQKGDAVVVLTTEGTPSSSPTAITLLSGVEPILQAAPNASQAMMLAPWSLGGGPGGEAGSQ